MDNDTLTQIERHLTAASSSLHQAWALATANDESHYGELADQVWDAVVAARAELGWYELAGPAAYSRPHTAEIEVRYVREGDNGKFYWRYGRNTR